VWFVSGNIDKDPAIEIVEKAREKLDLAPADIESFTDVRPIALEAGKATRIEEPLMDETNENSCVVAYYEVGLSEGGDMKMSLTNRIIMQFLNEPFFNDLRT
jgi:secreted Zn-dependent insulinase-like peptidase